MRTLTTEKDAIERRPGIFRIIYYIGMVKVVVDSLYSANVMICLTQELSEKTKKNKVGNIYDILMLIKNQWLISPFTNEI